MAQGWHGNSDGHRKAGRLGGLKSAAVRRRKAQQFREQVELSSPNTKRDGNQKSASASKAGRTSSKATQSSSG